MQVTAGKYRGRRLQSITSPRARPTARRLRESLFAILGPRIEGARFLDLCAGSGAVGIEALSRGAAHVTFVDRSRKMCSFIEGNLNLCGVPEDEAKVVISDGAGFLRRGAVCDGQEWDIAFYDPPYATDYLPVLITFGMGLGIKRKDGLLIVEHDHENELIDEVGGLRRWHLLKQGDSCLSFYEPNQDFQKFSMTPPFK